MTRYKFPLAAVDPISLALAPFADEVSPDSDRSLASPALLPLEREALPCAPRVAASSEPSSHMETFLMARPARQAPHSNNVVPISALSLSLSSLLDADDLTEHTPSGRRTPTVKVADIKSRELRLALLLLHR